MVIWLRVLSVAVMICLPSVSAQANQMKGNAEQSRQPNYGLSQTQVEGVTITRGKAYRPAREFPSDAERQKKRVNLSHTYRGTVFGKHQILRDGQTLYRQTLKPRRRVYE